MNGGMHQKASKVIGTAMKNPQSQAATDREDQSHVYVTLFNRVSMCVTANHSPSVNEPEVCSPQATKTLLFY
ncbi:hypothetical protein AOLI_G00135350 [Acnodon oligacanthus]